MAGLDDLVKSLVTSEEVTMDSKADPEVLDKVDHQRPSREETLQYRLAEGCIPALTDP